MAGKICKEQAGEGDETIEDGVQITNNKIQKMFVGNWRDVTVEPYGNKKFGRYGLDVISIVASTESLHDELTIFRFSRITVTSILLYRKL